MAVASSELLGIYKEWYTEEEIANLMGRLSPLVEYLEKIRVGGKTYNYPALYGAGGAASSDYTVAIANAANGQARDVQWAVNPGKIFSVFNLNQQEMLAADSDRGAFVRAAVNKMFAGTYGFRQQLAASIYGSGFGEIGTIQATGTSTDTSMTVSQETAQLLNIGTTFDVTTGSVPSGTVNADGPFTVTKKNGTTITFTRGGTTTAFTAGQYIQYHSDQTYPVGLAALIPDLYKRTGASWDTYIGTAFRGIDRSVDVNELAGQFVDASGFSAPKYSSGISQLEVNIRNAGGRPEIIALNPQDYWTIQNELQSYRNFWQSVDIPETKNVGPTMTYGIEAMRFAFSTSYIERVWDDPICPQGKAYVLEVGQKEKVTGGGFYLGCLSNARTPTESKIKGNEPGVDAVNNAPDVSGNPYQFLIDDYLEVRPGSDTSDGPAMRVTLSLYANWMMHQPAHCGVVDFV